TVNPIPETLGAAAALSAISAPGLSAPVVCATLCPVDLTLGCLKWAAVGFVVAFALLKLFEASHLHDDIPKPAFKIRQTKRATLVLSTFAAMFSALVWLLVQKLDLSSFRLRRVDRLVPKPMTRTPSHRVGDNAIHLRTD